MGHCCNITLSVRISIPAKKHALRSRRRRKGDKTKGGKEAHTCVPNKGGEKELLLFVLAIKESEERKKGRN